MRKLELKDVCGYLPYGLCAEIEICCDKRINRITSMGNSIISIPTEENKIGFSKVDICQINPILRPLSDLCKTITHNGKEIVPIVECAKISKIWKKNMNILGQGKKCGSIRNNKNEFGYIGEFDFNTFYAIDRKDDNCYWLVKNQVLLYDYLNELKIDYRKLIDEDLAIDCNTLENNPYK